MKLVVTINVDGRVVAGEGDCAGILRNFANLLSSGKIAFVDDEGDFPSGALRDATRSKVGEWEVVE